jgi:hypothetical protein
MDTPANMTPAETVEFVLDEIGADNVMSDEISNIKAAFESLSESNNLGGIRISLADMAEAVEELQKSIVRAQAILQSATR